jgi:hypothetical protein
MMAKPPFQKCPRCASALEAGFAARSAGLSFIPPEKFRSFAFVDEDLSGAGLRRVLPWKAEYFRSYLCQECSLYLVDYSEVLDRPQAQAIAAEESAAREERVSLE